MALIFSIEIPAIIEIMSLSGRSSFSSVKSWGFTAKIIMSASGRTSAKSVSLSTAVALGRAESIALPILPAPTMMIFSLISILFEGINSRSG